MLWVFEQASFVKMRTSVVKKTSADSVQRFTEGDINSTNLDSSILVFIASLLY